MLGGGLEMQVFDIGRRIFFILLLAMVVEVVTQVFFVDIKAILVEGFFLDRTYAGVLVSLLVNWFVRGLLLIAVERFGVSVFGSCRLDAPYHSRLHVCALASCACWRYRSMLSRL
jgi:hypothetical protein